MIEDVENSFIRLKYYRPYSIDPKENHSTEVLALCLRLSSKLRDEFLRLLGESSGFDNSWDVKTQYFHPTIGNDGKNSVFDLVLINETQGLVYIVEVNVESILRKEQIEKYCTTAPAAFPGAKINIFALLKLGEECPPGAKHITWSQVAEKFIDATKDSPNSTDFNVARVMAGYLEQECITMTLNLEDLAGYELGFRAEKAGKAFLTQCAEESKKLFPGPRFQETTRSGRPCVAVDISPSCSVELQFRVPGVANWEGDLLLCLNVVFQNAEHGELKAFNDAFEANKEWQYWGPDSRQRWTPIQNPATRTATSFAAFKPLISLRGPIPHPDTIHLRARSTFDNMEPAAAIQLAAKELTSIVKFVRSITPAAV
ncbi:MAG TPA: PD-(D/E)XK nuclease family protein [Opitutaceae bacterium]|nr:PD-(D/E)XK nuclease family protein [Opitutaceae bacterium]